MSMPFPQQQQLRPQQVFYAQQPPRPQQPFPQQVFYAQQQLRPQQPFPQQVFYAQQPPRPQQVFYTQPRPQQTMQYQQAIHNAPQNHVIQAQQHTPIAAQYQQAMHQQQSGAHNDYKGKYELLINLQKNLMTLVNPQYVNNITEVNDMHVKSALMAFVPSNYRSATNTNPKMVENKETILTNNISELLKDMNDYHNLRKGYRIREFHNGKPIRKYIYNNSIDLRETFKKIIEDLRHYYIPKLNRLIQVFDKDIQYDKIPVITGISSIPDRIKSNFKYEINPRYFSDWKILNNITLDDIIKHWTQTIIKLKKHVDEYDAKYKGKSSDEKTYHKLLYHQATQFNNLVKTGKNLLEYLCYKVYTDAYINTIISEYFKGNEGNEGNEGTSEHPPQSYNTTQAIVPHTSQKVEDMPTQPQSILGNQNNLPEQRTQSQTNEYENSYPYANHSAYAWSNNNMGYNQGQGQGQRQGMMLSFNDGGSGKKIIKKKPQKATKQTAKKPQKATKQTTKKTQKATKQTAKKPQKATKQTTKKTQKATKQTAKKPQKKTKKQ